MQYNTDYFSTVTPAESFSTGKKILFASVPADGHVNPLTGLASHLLSLGYDVRWYTSKAYQQKIEKLNIPFYPFKKSVEVTGTTIDEVFPERAHIKNQIRKLNFDLLNFFILRSVEYYEDLQHIHQEFPFEMVVADNAFSAIPFITQKMHIPVISIGIVPLCESSKDLAPYGLGITPATSLISRVKQHVLRFIADNILFKKPNDTFRNIFRTYDIPVTNDNVFSTLIHYSSLVLQSGTPGIEYYRSDLGKNIRYIGAVLPQQNKVKPALWFDDRLNKFDKIILVTQGTVEKDIEKILAPTLQAFVHSDVLVIATTGGSQTAELRKRFTQQNFIIEDFIPFTEVMPYADIYVTNGGYGGVTLAIQHSLPMIVAGVHEGKNEINARVGFFKLGINLRTETPGSSQIRTAADKIFADKSYRQNVEKLAQDYKSYDTLTLFEKHVKSLSKSEIHVDNLKGLIN